MGRWKRCGVVVVEYAGDHSPRHVHVFEDDKQMLKFNIEQWQVMKGILSPRARKALEELKEEGVFNARPKI